ncbi:hypothetical protein FH972_014062 [Carpinus fangiana]|uniref:DUF7796 domain-containing protein n=1 Tax=Carpinus fangiana TaxID=176857 RepID=A0A5N6R9M2_9ROSI|nr:hypothetical protein FH972_014062 [Carpinus fangiana]
MLKNGFNITMQFSRRVSSDLDWRLLLLIIPPLFLFLFVSLSANPRNPLSSIAPLRSFILSHAIFQLPGNTTFNTSASPSATPSRAVKNPSDSEVNRWRKRKDELNRSIMAVCLVGGARRFELSGPSIVDKILREMFIRKLLINDRFIINNSKNYILFPYFSSDFLHAYFPNFQSSENTPTSFLYFHHRAFRLQGLLQYFNLVEGCLTMIKAHQKQKNFTYDWIVRTRVDGYWNAPLHPRNFVPGKYLVPPGSTYGGLNDRFGVGDLNTSTVALSRLSLIPQLDLAGFQQLNSETSFRAQLTIRSVPYLTKRLPFCVVTDRRYSFPPIQYGVPVAALSSPGPLSGAKCRPCKPVCEGSCVASVMSSLNRGWSWTDWGNGTLRLCDAHGEWESGWERIFDRIAGKNFARARKRVRDLTLEQCVEDFNEMKRRMTGKWESPPPEAICRLGGLA